MSGTDEEFVPEEEVESTPQALKNLREKLKKTVEEKQQYLENWQRDRADFANYKKEDASRSSEKEVRLRAELAEALLPALDSFEMAFRSKSFIEGTNEWKSGIMSVYRELVRSLERFGIQLFNPLGETFDPRKHEAVREVEVKKQDEDHTVVSVERSGYAVGEHIIRPAQVTIGSYKK